MKKRPILAWILVPALGVILSFSAGHSVAGEAGPNNIDAHGKWGGLPPGPGRDDIFHTCQACHSLRIIKQQGLGRSSWDETLEWMVEEQGMGEPDAAIRERILDYLATHFGSGQSKH